MALEFVSGFIASSLLQELVDKIKASATDTISLAYSMDVEEELKNLESSYVKAQSMLDKLDGWDLITSKPHRDWLGDMRRACYDVEDFTQHLNLEVLKKLEDVNFLKSYWTRWGVSRKLRDVQTNLDALINLSDRFATTGHRISESRMQDVSRIEPVTVPDDGSFRRKQVKEEVIGFLLDHNCNSRCRVVSITGMFGIGKTTLAQVVKNDSLVQSHFNHTLWVSVCGDFNLGKVLYSMILDLQLEQIQENGLRLSPPYSHQLCVRMFQGLCKGRRVLVVLDDLCDFIQPQDWEDFQSLLLDPFSCGFGVVITTRNPRVATMVDSLGKFPVVNHYLERISDEDCQSMILNKAAAVAVDNPAKRKLCGKTSLEMITLEIAENFCKGLPLVANIFGHRLCLNPTVNRWAIMLTNDIWNLPEFKQIFSAFRLNYRDLSGFLKNCVPYFSLFPDNYNYKKEELVSLWLAEGFIKPRVAGTQYLEYPSLEELGNCYFDEVLSQSILQIFHPFNQTPQIYKMHEFIHQYAKLIGSDMYIRVDEQFIDASDNTDTLTPAKIVHQYKNARHLSFLCPNIPTLVWKKMEKFEGLRTILSLHQHTNIGKVNYTIFLKLQSLRVLDLSKTDITEIPESVGKLKHLHLLDLSKTDIQELPSSTSNLRGLLVLKLNCCPLLLQLPKDIKNLIYLLHLEADIKGLSCMAPRIGNLRNLRTLSAFIVGRKDGYRISELKNMKYLQGSICLTNLENVNDEVEAREAMIYNKPFLKRLELEWNKYSYDQSLAEKILSGLQPHENLEELQVSGYDSDNFPSWVSSLECKLRNIHLVRCYRCRILPPLGRLQHLKSLHIEELHKVKLIDIPFFGCNNIVGFPSLEYLKICDMMSLEKWEGLQVNQMPQLRDLVITDCPNLVSLPCLNLLSCLVKLEISCCPVLQALPETGFASSLNTLIVSRSDLLKQRCIPVEGADWNKIKDVPIVIIDFQKIDSSGP